MSGTWALENRFEAVSRPRLQLQHGLWQVTVRHLVNRLSIRLWWGRCRGCQAKFHSAPSPMAYVAITISKALGRRGWRETGKELMPRDLIGSNVIWSDSSSVRFIKAKTQSENSFIIFNETQLKLEPQRPLSVVDAPSSSSSVLCCALCSVLVSGPPGVDGSRNKSKNTIAIHV